MRRSTRQHFLGVFSVWISRKCQPQQRIHSMRRFSAKIGIPFLQPHRNIGGMKNEERLYFRLTLYTKEVFLSHFDLTAVLGNANCSLVNRNHVRAVQSRWDAAGRYLVARFISITLSDLPHFGEIHEFASARMRWKKNTKNRKKLNGFRSSIQSAFVHPKLEKMGNLKRKISKNCLFAKIITYQLKNQSQNFN